MILVKLYISTISCTKTNNCARPLFGHDDPERQTSEIISISAHSRIENDPILRYASPVPFKWRVILGQTARDMIYKSERRVVSWTASYTLFRGGDANELG